MLDLELFIEFGDHHIVDICTIVSDDSLWHTVSTNQVMPDKPRHNVLGYSSKGSILNLFCEVIDGYQNEAMSVRRSRYDLADHVDAPHCKGPRSCQYVQKTGGTCTLSA